ncbi:hypothetical protein K435DRAFT_298814 [Dendrothele bispora CBS 962.96]|uniref:SMAD/FHA domain-containing protein n=1 Tax=Dendrothele bispora (strain CBS 962.96) TaxID=1314807 RepID=A0A4S8MK94_DENBC|nr:hypothetical protein K435DRAFT_298814 [Dendrothele bispora CBS 962.96]
MEDPSIHHSSSTHTTHDYAQYGCDESYEGPRDFSNNTSELPSKVSHQQHLDSDRANDVKGCLRVLVSSSQALPPANRIALLDGFTEIQFGRDVSGSGTPRIRLKEMEVSKLHAAIYWDQSWNGWGLVDMGSKHGTFLRSSTGPSIPDSRGVRLSAPKSTSIPKRLYHLDEIGIGSTTFIVHIHENVLPCEGCSPTGGDEIPLFPTTKQKSAIPQPDSSRTNFHDPKAKIALTELKRNLLSGHDEKPPLAANSSRRTYVDRSALRRAKGPSSDVPGVVRAPTVRHDQVLEEPKSQPETPIPESSVGHKLLMKQGWEPGTSLGLNGEGPVDPIDMRGASSYDRTGLGSKRKRSNDRSDNEPVGSKVEWKDKYSRWNNERL